ncbi:hypothetical protein ANME2D_01179 [Candidatus Methanoperedens nitroreducens]|uniref:ArnR1-like winged helix-turn-helix domain-containing protein n=1 Tax=Candidatus Methanoperedens nitratireducens TaxID=1392998 RepID=A0A062VBR3_9EURY|nr:hypothetical protein [Candidatus Methanoperedens nitroreducens]KCZ72745.1 hypothetical protein ANME2D_01179 [Candidatus Methanoperedens nitroreducens]MDJ1423322.1 hypothetical protein [Candidatus Methanoperedens sp.]
MKNLDRILELLSDFKWCSINEIKTRISLPSDRLNEALSFLQEQSFISREDEKLRITPRGLKLLEIPS